MRGLRAFVRLSRLKFLAGGFFGGALGTLVALYERSGFDLRAFLLAQLTITAAHIMTQYANDYFDRESDARTTRTPFSGGSGALVDGSLAPHVALAAALASLALSASGALALALAGHALAAVLGLACIVLGWAYSAPPLRLLARGLGEVDSALVVAMLVPLCAYAAQTGALDARILVTTLPAAAAMLAMMVCVQVPDLAADTATGKRNLVVRFGTRFGASFGLTALAATVVGVGAALVAGAPQAFAWCEVAALLPGLHLAGALRTLRSGAPVRPDDLARRGVFVFAAVSLLGALGYAQAVRFAPHVPAATGGARLGNASSDGRFTATRTAHGVLKPGA